MSNILSISNLEKSYDSLNGEVFAIDNLSLEVKDGEFLSIIGSSGCGKSTILNILAGLDNDYKGNVKFRDDVKISYMLQEDALFPWLSVYENAIIGLKIEKQDNKENTDYVKYLLEKYGLKDFINKKVSNLSGGMRQRVV